MAVTSLTIKELATLLERQLGNPAKLSAVSTRILLRTGVNLREVRPDQETDQALAGRVRDVMAEMGYRF